MLKSKNIFSLIVSQVFSRTSERLLVVGFSWYIIKNYDSDNLVKFFMLTLLPNVIIIFFSGNLINRFASLIIVRISDLLKGLIYISLSFILFFKSNYTLDWCYLFSFFANFLSSISNPAVLTLPKQIVNEPESQRKVLGLFNTSSSCARIIGPIIAIPIYMAVDMQGLVLFSGILYFLAFVLECFIKVIPLEIKVIKDNFFSTLCKPYKLFKKYKIISMLMINFFINNLLIIPIQLFLPYIVKNFFAGNMKLLSLCEAVFGIGLVIGGVYTSFFKISSKAWKRVTLPYIIFSLCYILFSFSKSEYLFIISLTLMGVFLAIGNVTSLHFFQDNVENEESAHIMSYVNFISTASAPLAMGLVGIFSKMVNFSLLIEIYSLLSLFGCAFILLNKEYVRVR